jgi:hypothetical protein
MVQEPLPTAASTPDESRDQADSREALPESEPPTVTETVEPPEAGVEARQEETQPAAAEADEAGDWWKSPATAEPEPEPPLATAEVSPASSTLEVDQAAPETPATADITASDEAEATPVLAPPPVKPRIFKPETGPEPKLTLPPASRSPGRETSTGESQMSGDSEVGKLSENELPEPTFEATTQSYLEKADAESSRARQLASEVENAVELQSSKPAGAPSESSETALPSTALPADQFSRQKPMPVVPASSPKPPDWAHELWGSDVDDEPAPEEKLASSTPEEDQQPSVEQASSTASPAKASDSSPGSDPADWWNDDLIDSQSRREQT